MWREPFGAVNSPLFYRLNYARITGHIIYLKSAQVKDFLNILQRKFIRRKNPPFGVFLLRCRLGVDEKKSGKNHELFVQKYSALFRIPMWFIKMKICGI